MVLAFLLIVTVNQDKFGEEQPMVFRDIYRCWHFASVFEHGARSRKYNFSYDTPVTAYCVPHWITEDAEFQD